MEVRVRLRISGKVQGVFFRKSAKIEADRLSVLGWVKNLDDGFVGVVAQGKMSMVDKFIVWCKHGPPFAKVENVEVEWMKKLEDFESFEIIE